MFDELVDVPMRNCCEINVFLCWVWTLKKIELFFINVNYILNNIIQWLILYKLLYCSNFSTTMINMLCVYIYCNTKIIN